MATIVNTHPGQLIKEFFLEDRGITPYALAKGTGMAQTHIGEILRGERGITAKTAVRFGQFFDVEPETFMNMQSHYELTNVLWAARDDKAKAEEPVGAAA